MQQVIRNRSLTLGLRQEHGDHLRGTGTQGSLKAKGRTEILREIHQYQVLPLRTR